MDWDADPKNPLDMKMMEVSKIIIADAFETLNENR
jgi:hypothetical protein